MIGVILFIYLFILISWRLITLQYCSGFKENVRTQIETQREDHVKTEKHGFYKPKRGASTETTLILTSSLPTVSKFLLFKPYCPWYFVTVAQANLGYLLSNSLGTYLGVEFLDHIFIFISLYIHLFWVIS